MKFIGICISIVAVLAVLAVFAAVNRAPRDAWCYIRTSRYEAKQQCREESNCHTRPTDLAFIAEFDKYCGNR